MCLDDRAADGKPQADSLGFGREEGLEQMFRGFGVNPHTGIRYRNRCAASILIPGFDHYQARRRLGAIHGINRVNKQINDHLLQLHRVPQSVRETGIQIQLDAGISGHRITLDQLDRILCQAIADL